MMNRAALQSSRRVVELLPHSQGMQANLALDQMLVGDLQGARATCERAIADNLDGDGIRVRYLQVTYALQDEALLNEQRAWRAEHPQAVLVLGEETAIAVAEGRFRDARKLMLMVRACNSPWVNVAAWIDGDPAAGMDRVRCALEQIGLHLQVSSADQLQICQRSFQHFKENL